MSVEKINNSILIVDDDYINRFIMRKIFENSGYQIYEAIDGIDATIKLDKHKDISVILMDLDMPWMNGYKLINYLDNNNHMKHRDISVIVVSAYTYSYFAQTMKAENIVTSKIKAFHAKPVSFTKIKQEVSDLFRCNKLIRTGSGLSLVK